MNKTFFIIKSVSDVGVHGEWKINKIFFLNFNLKFISSKKNLKKIIIILPLKKPTKGSNGAYLSYGVFTMVI